MNLKNTYKAVNKALETLKVNTVLDRLEETKQAKKVTELINKSLTKQIESALTVEHMERAMQLTRKADVNEQLVSYFGDYVEDLDEETRNELYELMVMAANAGGQAAVDRFEQDLDFELEDESFLGNRLNEVIGVITTTTLIFLATQVESARDGLLTPEEAIELIKEKVPDITESRAQLIVEQEIANAAGTTEHEVFRRSRVLTLEWNTVLDERVCPICSPMDGQVRSADAEFLGGDGSTALHPPIHVRCRCFLTPKETNFVGSIWTGN